MSTAEGDQRRGKPVPPGRTPKAAPGAARSPQGGDATPLTRRDQLAALRRSLYRSMPASLATSVSDADLSADHASIAAKYRAGDVASSWAGAALAMMRACEAAEFRAWVYRFGFDEDAPAAVTIVELDGRRIVQDCFFNEECDLDLPELLEIMERGEAAPWRAETRDDKTFLLPAAHREDVEWIVAHAGVELEPLAGLRRFPLHHGGHVQRAMKDHQRGLDRMPRIGLAKDLHFLLLNPISVFDGVSVETDPARMPIVSEWIGRGGRTLQRQLGFAAHIAEAGETARKAQTNRELADAEALLAAFGAERRGWLNEKLDLQRQLDELGAARERDASRLTLLGAELERLNRALVMSARELGDAEERAALLAEERVRSGAEMRIAAATLTVNAAADLRIATAHKEAEMAADLRVAEAERQAAMAAELGMAALNEMRERHGAELAAAEQQKQAAIDHLVSALEAARSEHEAALAAAEGERHEQVHELRTRHGAVAQQLEARLAEAEGAHARLADLEQRLSVQLERENAAAQERAGLAEALSASREEAGRLAHESQQASARVKVLESELAVVQTVLRNSRYMKLRRAVSRLLGG